MSKKQQGNMATPNPIGFQNPGSNFITTTPKQGNNFSSIFQMISKQFTNGLKGVGPQRQIQQTLPYQSMPQQSLYASDGGKLEKKSKSELPCGCSMEEDGIDTDVFYDAPDDIVKALLQLVGMSDIKSEYDDDVKKAMKMCAHQEGKKLDDFLSQDSKIKVYIIRHQMGGQMEKQIDPETNYKEIQTIVEQDPQFGKYLEDMVSQLSSTQKIDPKKALQMLVTKVPAKMLYQEYKKQGKKGMGMGGPQYAF